MAYQEPPSEGQAGPGPALSATDLAKQFKASRPYADIAGGTGGVGNDNTSIGHEATTSRPIIMDIQRAGTVVVFYIMGTPDCVHLSALLQLFHVGDQHLWAAFSDLYPIYGAMYVTNIKIDHHVPGESAPDVNTTTTWKYAHAWSRVTITYRQRCSPRAWEQHWRTALVSRNEWYTREYLIDDWYATGLLSGDMRAIPVMVRVPIVTRHWPKVHLTESQIHVVNEATGKLNPDDFLGYVQSVWMLDGADFDLLYRSGPGLSGDGYYEVTLVFRGDIERKHEYWVPRTDEVTRRPLTPPFPYERYANMHIRKRLYGLSATPFEDLIPAWQGYP